ncbi:MAG: PilZ domain-containing protein [Myxococcales bacterium]|nr:PilZ domain-containing protein [Myxococcales bacterium]
MLNTRNIRPMERRDSDRRPCRMPVRVLQQDGDPEHDSFWLDSADLSPGGVFLRTDLLFPVGEELELEFTIPGRARPVRGQGRVVRVVANRQSGAGLAVRLDGLVDEERRALGRMGSAEGRAVSRHAQIHFDA